MQCKFCKKDLINTPGKKPKQFCGDTCRSNFWYDKNIKGGKKKIKSKPPEKPIEPPKTLSNQNVRKPYLSEAMRKKLGL